MTNTHIFSLVAALLTLIGIVKADDDAVTLAAAPPVVVKTIPEAGTDGVDSAVTEIKVTYSKDMTDGSWSWSTWGKDTFPEMTGKPHYLDDKRTCVLPVKLQPGRTYAIWLNSNNFGNFKDASGKSAVPYLLIFKTAASSGHALPSTRPTKEQAFVPRTLIQGIFLAAAAAV
jgi:RNA polymerase sigma-70 factor (ECF subfamily)